MNPLEALASLVNGFWRTHEVGEWLKAWGGVLLSGICGFLGGCGDHLYRLREPFPVAVGFGMLAADFAMFAVVTSNKKLRGTVVGLWKPPVIPPEALKIEVDKT